MMERITATWPMWSTVSEALRFRRSATLATNAGLVLSVVAVPHCHAGVYLRLFDGGTLLVRETFPDYSIDAASDWINKQVNDFLSWK